MIFPKLRALNSGDQIDALFLDYCFLKPSTKSHMKDCVSKLFTMELTNVIGFRDAPI